MVEPLPILLIGAGFGDLPLRLSPRSAGGHSRKPKGASRLLLGEAARSIPFAPSSSCALPCSGQALDDLPFLLRRENALFSEWVCSHPERPTRARDGRTLADLAWLKAATVETSRPKGLQRIFFSVVAGENRQRHFAVGRSPISSPPSPGNGDGWRKSDRAASDRSVARRCSFRPSCRRGGRLRAADAIHGELRG